MLKKSAIAFTKAVVKSSGIDKKIEDRMKQYFADNVTAELNQSIHGILQTKDVIYRDDMMAFKNSLHNSILGQRKTLIDFMKQFAQQNIEPLPQSDPSYTYEKAEQQVKSLVPRAYELWLQCQAEGEITYTEDPINNLAVHGHRSVDLFYKFLSIYLTGNILDIGCGPQKIPFYLKDHPIEHIAGLDPIGEPSDHDFHFVKGFAEYLPWQDNSFDQVIISTSLDHMLHLDKVLEEISRVVKKDGVFLAWLGFLPGAKKYDPYDPNLDRIDPCHIYHFDRGWFEDTIQEKFSIYEAYEIYYPHWGNVLDCFYALKPLK